MASLPADADVYTLAVSEGGHTATVCYKANAGFFIQRNALTYGPYPTASDPVVSPTGTHALWIVQWERRDFELFLSGEAIAKHEHIWAPVVSQTGAAIAYCASTHNRSFVTWNGLKQPEFSTVNYPTLSKDGTALAYKATRGAHEFVVFNQRKSNPYRHVGPPVISPDGTRVAFEATGIKEGTESLCQFVVADGRLGPAFDVVGQLPRGVGEPAVVFSPSSEHIAYPAQLGGRWTVVLDEAKLGWYDQVTKPVFSEDGRLAFIGRKGSSYYIATPDGQHGPFADVAALSFPETDHQLSFAYRDGEGWKIRHGTETILVDQGPVDSILVSVEGALGFAMDDPKGFRFKTSTGQFRIAGRLVGGPRLSADGRAVCIGTFEAPDRSAQEVWWRVFAWPTSGE